MNNYMEGDGLLRAENENEEEVKRLQKKAKTSAKPKAVPAPKKPAASVTDAGTPGKGARRLPRKKRRFSKSTIS